jgi:hypothetical protein
MGFHRPGFSGSAIAPERQFLSELLGGLGSRSGSRISRSSLSRSSGVSRSGLSRSSLGRSLGRSSLGSRSFGRSLGGLTTASGQSERSENGAKSELRLHFAFTPKSKVQMVIKQPS